MKQLSIEANVAMTEKRLDAIAADAEAQAETDGVEKYRKLHELETSATDRG